MILIIAISPPLSGGFGRLKLGVELAMLWQLYGLFCTEQQDCARSCDGAEVDSERTQTINRRGG